MQSLISKCLFWSEFLWNGGLDSDSSDHHELRQRRIVALTIMTLVPFGLVIVWMNILIDQADDNPFVISAIVLGISAMFLQAFLGHSRLAAHLVVFSIWMAASLAMMDRSVYGISSIWLLILPVFATLLINGLGGVLWAGASMLTLGFYTVLEMLYNRPPPATPDPAIVAFEASIALLLTLGATLVFRFGQVAAERRLEQAIEKLHSEMEVRKAAELAAKQAEEIKGEFLASMSHELRTPLNGVIGAVELLAHTALSEEQGELVNTVQNSGQLLLNLISDVLDVSRLDAGAASLEIKEFDFCSTCAAVCDSLSVNAEQKGLQLVAEIDPQVGWRVGDPVRVQQIIINLLGNAIKFTQKGQVTFSCLLQSSGILLSVKDTGIGIPAEAQDSLFDAYQQASSSTARKFGGAGLGLSIVYRLVVLMQGRISLDSEPGRGSEFRVSLPLAPCQVQDQHIDSNIADKRSKSLKVLVADDNTTNRMVARKMLGLLGHDVCEAADGEEVMDRLADQEVDMIFMDVEMPKVDGREATRRIRRCNDVYNCIPIVGLTANALPGDREQLLNLGMNDYLVKPLKMQSLARVIDSFGIK